MSMFYYVMERWPELHVTKPRGLLVSAIRAKSASPDAVGYYCMELESILKKYNLENSPESMYNIDEKGIDTEHKRPCVVYGKEIPAQAPEKKQSPSLAAEMLWARKSLHSLF